jgi:hypothetical protein
MRQIVIVSGVLGGGSALVFALAALAATLFPNGTLVASGWNGGFAGGWGKGGIAQPMPMPMPDPAVGPNIPGKGIVIQNGIEPAATDGDVEP